ncbi:hypothetical protein, partial [Streptomyces sp. IB201691-2A2]|uniref:hypothetical protein n=1 Tax=Streptomyces sp. IB201691-2A2 TaxID=2561920 RepID=UPI001CA72D34
MRNSLPTTGRVSSGQEGRRLLLGQLTGGFHPPLTTLRRVLHRQVLLLLVLDSLKVQNAGTVIDQKLMGFSSR